MADWYHEVFQDRLSTGLKVVRRIYRAESEFQKIEIVETEQFGRTLILDGIFQTSEGDEHYYHEMLVQPAMTVAPRIERVLVIGGGDGGTVREVLRHPQVQAAVMVEIDGKVVEACREHLPTIGSAWDDPRLTLTIADGVDFVKRSDVEPFDVILLDGSDPVGPSEGLFDAEFYRGCKRLLGPGGVFALQSESPVLFPEVFAEIYRALNEIFERVDPYVGTVPLYGAGMWTWTIASDGIDPRRPDPERCATIAPAMRYYNREIHTAAFALPADARRLIGV